MDRIKEFIQKYKLQIIIIAAVILLAAASILVFYNLNKDRDTEEEPETTAVAETESQTEPKTEPPTKEVPTEPAPEIVELPYINPLTGEGSAVDYSNTRPLTIMINTIKEALPQSGNSQADILIEMAEEGGITRILGIYQDVTGVGNIGTVRSTREYFLSWARAFDGILVHAGGDSWVLNEIRKGGYRTVDFQWNSSSAFWRDPERLQYLSLEHTLYTSSDRLQNWITTHDFPMQHTKQNYTTFNFTEELDDNVMTEAATSVKVTMSGYKSTVFNYNEATSQYDVYFWDNEPYMDSASGTQIAVTNILVLPVPNWNDVDAWGRKRQKYDLSGGVGYYISGGKYTQINWSKGDYNKQGEYGNPLVLTNANGEPLELAVGKTYICVIGNQYGVSFTGE